MSDVKNRQRQPRDGAQMIYSERADRYFSDPDEALRYAKTHGLSFEEARFVLCEPHYLSFVGADTWEDDLPEGGKLPPEVEEARRKLNEAIAAAPPSSWYPGDEAWDGTIASSKL